MNINPQRLKGDWEDGWALDLHTKHSYKTENGHFKTEYTPMGQLLHELKYKVKNELISTIAKVATDFINKKYSEKYPFPVLDYIICVPPSDVSRKLQPVFEIAKEIEKIIKKDVYRYRKIRILKDALIKTKETPVMKNLSREQSQKMLKGIFKIDENKKDLLQNKNILILDDLFGTGITITEITRTIQLQSHSKNVFVLTLTKTRTSGGMRD